MEPAHTVLHTPTAHARWVGTDDERVSRRSSISTLPSLIRIATASCEALPAAASTSTAASAAALPSPLPPSSLRRASTLGVSSTCRCFTAPRATAAAATQPPPARCWVLEIHLCWITPPPLLRDNNAGSRDVSPSRSEGVSSLSGVLSLTSREPTSSPSPAAIAASSIAPPP